MPENTDGRCAAKDTTGPWWRQWRSVRGVKMDGNMLRETAFVCAVALAGGAVGAALERSNGRIRLELEGRYRDPIEQTFIGFNRMPPRLGPGPVPPKPDLIGTMQAKSYDGWSALANL